MSSREVNSMSFLFPSILMPESLGERQIRHLSESRPMVARDPPLAMTDTPARLSNLKSA